MASFLRKRGQSETEHSAPVNVGHVRLAHGAFVRSVVFTVAILAQGTNRGDALCAALLLRRVGSNPTATTFFPILVILCKTANAFGLRERYDAGLRKKIAGHVRRAHGALVRPLVFTVAILAQGTNRGDALCAALLLRRMGSNPTRALFFVRRCTGGA